MSELVTTDSIINVDSEIVPTEQPTTQSLTNVPGHLLCKSRLQEFVQKSGIPLPVYQTINEGAHHAPRFRSTVYVDGAYITSPTTFPLRKAAEHGVANVALACLTQKIKDEGYPIIREDTVFCKSILIEYAMKMNLERPTYTTIQPKGLLPCFISSLVFNGVNYTGEAGRSKKEAEQLAARAVILSIFDNNESGTIISEIIKSKFRLYDALHKIKGLHNNTPLAENTGAAFVFPFSNEGEVETTGNDNATMAVEAENSLGFPLSDKKDVVVTGAANHTMGPSKTSASQISKIPTILQPFHEFKKRKLEPSPVAFTPIAFVPPTMEQPPCGGPSSARNRNRRQRKKMKKLQVDAQLPVGVMQVVPHNQVAPCSVAQ